MKTEDLIGALVADTATPTRPLATRMTVAAVIGADRLPEHLRDSAEFLLTSRDQYRRPAAGQ